MKGRLLAMLSLDLKHLNRYGFLAGSLFSAPC